MDTSRAARDTGQTTLIRALRRPGAYPHAAANIELLDTHISWVLLAGEFAYKIKKDVKLEFLDFSTLELRRHFCEEELRLNRRWAPDLYLEVVPICGSVAEPVIGGGGEVIEYAVKMVRFPQEAQLDRQLEEGLLQPQDVTDLAETIAGYHEASPAHVFTTDADALAHVGAPMLDNFAPLEPLADAMKLATLREWTERSLSALETTLIERHRGGFVRDCHGDLNLTNLVRLPSGIAAYDCVEFSAELRNIDVMSDMSFLFMDLHVRRRQDLAFLLINRYLERTGDYSGIAVLGLYFVYHCLIRAKIAAIRASKRQESQARGGDLAELRRLVDVAHGWLNRPPASLIAMHGFSGSGKTWLSGQLLARLPAIRVRSDIERKRVHGLGELEGSDSDLGQGIYTDTATRYVYEHLMRLAADALSAGYCVIIDASFLNRAERDMILALADRRRVALLFLDTVADDDELRRRLRDRTATGGQASEAGASVLEHQYTHYDALTAAEESRTIHIATSADVDVVALVDSIAEHLNEGPVQ